MEVFDYFYADKIHKFINMAEKQIRKDYKIDVVRPNCVFILNKIDLRDKYSTNDEGIQIG